MRRDEKSLERVVLFSDAVVAIAITLLVLPLTEIDAADYDGNVGELLSDNSASLWAFAISFAVISMFWLAHHGIFGRLKAVDPTVVVINLAWLACIVFLPFPTSLVQETDAPSFTSFYIGWLLLTAVMGKVLALTISGRPELWREPRDDEASEASLRGWMIVAGFAVAFVASFISPSLGLYALLLLALVGPAARVISKGRRGHQDGGHPNSRPR